MSDVKKVVLVGIGGYGGTYANAVLTRPDPASYQVVGVVDPFAAKAYSYEQLKAQGIPFFDTLEEFYKTNSADLAVLATPISLHCPQTCCALEHGSNVLCEKPVSAIPDEAIKMLEASKAAKRFVAIGYQWSFSPAIQALKADILAGKFGAPKFLKTQALWPRSDTYYARNNWAGAKKNAKGDWILDSPVNNAVAHYLHNMLYVMGDKVDSAAEPTTLTAELYRANAITNFDTASLDIQTKCGARVLFLTSHAISKLRGPEFVYTFEKGVATYNYRERIIRAQFANGETKDYGTPDCDVTTKFWDCLDVLHGKKKTILCGVEAALMHSRCVWAANKSVPTIPEFPAENIYKMGVPGSQVKVMEGLADAMEKAYEAGTMLHEQSSASWLHVGKTVKA